MLRILRDCLLTLSIFCILSSATAQEIPREFILLTDSVIENEPITYKGLDGFLRPHRRDTLLMGYFIEKSKDAQFWDGLAYSYNQLGTRYRNISEYNKAITYHNKALDAASKADNKEFKIFSLNMLGVVYRRMDAIKTALDYNQEALRLAESIENPSIGIRRSKNVSLNSLGNIYQALEQYDRALEYYNRSLILERALDNKRGMAVNLQNRGECLEAQGKLNEALRNYRDALAYDIEIGSDRGIAICHNSISRIYIKQGRYEEALELLEQALPVALNTRDQHIIAPMYNNLGWAHLQAGQLSQAEIALEKGLKAAIDNQLVHDISQSYNYLSDLSAARGGYRNALEYYKRAQEYREQINNDINRKYVNDVILKYNSEKQRNLAESLRQENQIVNLRLRRNQTTLLIGALLVVLLALILYIAYRQYQTNNEKKVMALEQSRLRSQMNPHFLFNSLNSIKHYIINNEQKNAVHYLNKFSKLVRRILESSSMKENSLKEELETVDLYMNIENIRFEEQIDYQVDIDPKINPETVKIPSLILQPFLENALWHGLSSKEGEKKIRLEIRQNNKGYINIAIRDNGIGRQASKKLREAKVLKRKSMGISITRQRLANFSRMYRDTFDLSIQDLYQGDGTVAGTEVNLKIPTA
jgi:tetratricopeptide (TPR) repeat protein